jgi:regulator of sigma E protease
MDLLIGVALVLGVMILVHEWGHFIVARMFRVRVDVFSIGFGPRLFGWKHGPTDYRISALPVGGYVRMAGQDLSDIDSGEKAPTGAKDELMSKPRWQRALISFAGPAVNLLFPVLLLAGYFVLVGVPYPSYQDKPVQVTALPANSTAQAAGLQPGDRLTQFGAEKNPNWEQVEQVLSKISPKAKLPVEIERAGVHESLQLPVSEKDLEQPDLLLGFAPIRPVMEDVMPGLPAARGGLKEGDLIEAVNGQKIQWWGEFTERIRGSNGKPVALDVDRHGQNVHLVVTPQQATNERGEPTYQIGVQVHQDVSYRRTSVSQSVNLAGVKTWDTIDETIGVVGKLLSGKASLKQMYGPVGISRAAGQAAHKGSLAIISLMVLISVNLGILNLLPIPILDGGHILLLAIEGGMRRDLSLAFKERFVQVGLVFLLVVFAIVMYNDVVRLLPIHS